MPVLRISFRVLGIVLACASLMMVPAIQAQEAARKAPGRPAAEVPSWPPPDPFEHLLRRPPGDSSAIAAPRTPIQQESRDVIFRGAGSEGSSIVPATDNGFIVIGASGYPPRRDAWIMRVDSNLKLLWEKFYGATKFVRKARATASGGVIVVGHSVRSTGREAFVLMLDKEGDSVWEKALTSSGARPTGVAVLPDSVVVTGHDNEKGWIRRLDNATGNEIWAIEPSPQAGTALSNHRLAPGAISTFGDGTMAVAGLALNREWDPATDPAKFMLTWFMKIDSAGKAVMGPVVVESQYQPLTPLDIVPLSDGDLALTGHILAPDPNTLFASYAWLARVTAQGAVRWQYRWGRDGDYSAAMMSVPLPDGHFVAVISSEQTGAHFRRHGTSESPVAVTQRGGPPAGFAGRYPVGMTFDALLHKEAGRNRLIGVGSLPDSLWLFSLPAIELGIE